MQAEFTAVFEVQADGWIMAYVPEIPGVTTQGKTMEETRANLGEALRMILESYRSEAMAEAGANAIFETIQVEIPSLHETA